LTGTSCHDRLPSEMPYFPRFKTLLFQALEPEP
jgi:hypothetical protein